MPSGGYKNLLSFKQARIISDFTFNFCECYIDRFSRTKDQMVQAARSGKQNIAEGSQFSRTSSKTEIKLLGVARASLQELLEDYEDFLRQRGLPIWDKNSPQAKQVRQLSYKTDKSYETYKSYMSSPETAANCAICLINQANYLLDRQINAVEKEFIQGGGYTENLFKKRLQNRRN